LSYGRVNNTELILDSDSAKSRVVFQSGVTSDPVAA